MELNYCPVCGTKLITKEIIIDGKALYCTTCQDYRFPLYNVAVSLIVLDKNHTHVLLIQQYNKKDNILVAGYINKGESVLDAIKRELKEETQLEALETVFNDSSYYQPSETLMLNYVVTVKDTQVVPNEEIDDYHWYTLFDAKKYIKPNSLASHFLNKYLDD